MAAPYDVETRSSATPREAAPVRQGVAQRPSGGPVTFGPGHILGMIGFGGIVASLFLSWHEPRIHPDQIPVAFLWHRASAAADPSLLIFLIPIAVIVAIGAFVPLGGPLRFLGGIAMLAVAAVIAYQLHQVVDGTGGDLGDALGTGFYVGAIGGLFAFLSGLMLSPWSGRRVVRSEVVEV